MIDIHTYMNLHNLKKEILNGKVYEPEELYAKFEEKRSKEPVVFNIETTNACNMTCIFCPRTTLMTRKIEHLEEDVCDKIIEQMRPWTEEEWAKWEEFVFTEYGIKNTEMNQNHFFFYIIPRVVVLHGFGDPLLDKKLARRVKLLTDKGIDTYFSCNPSNINVKKNLEMMEAGLKYLKFSIDSIDDMVHKELRGKASNYTRAYEKIMTLLKEKEERGLETTILITMIDLQRPTQMQEWKQLQESFEGKDVYIYLKSQDQTWYEDIQGKKDLHAAAGRSIVWSEFCMYPWVSLTVKSNGEIAMCTEDYNNEIILGDANSNSLYDIWNGQLYGDFRMRHFTKKSGDPCMMCTDHCDKKVVGDFIN